MNPELQKQLEFEEKLAALLEEYSKAGENSPLELNAHFLSISIQKYLTTLNAVCEYHRTLSNKPLGIDDGDRFRWFFGPHKSPDHVQNAILDYMRGIREEWNIDTWRAFCDKYILIERGNLIVENLKEIQNENSRGG